MNWKTLLVVAAILALPHASLAADRDPPAVGAAKPACPMSIGERWEATDSLARRLPGFDQVGPTRPGKYVAIFYWTWHMGSGVDKARSQSGGSVANVSRIIAQYPTARSPNTPTPPIGARSPRRGLSVAGDHSRASLRRHQGFGRVCGLRVGGVVGVF